MTEACFLFQHLPEATTQISDWLDRGVIHLDFSLATRHRHVFTLLRKYRSVPMSLADACLLCMAEEAAGSQIFTTDPDFNIYRLHGRKEVPHISPVS